MSKKTKETETESELVALEMTTTEAQEFANWKIAKEAKEAEDKATKERGTGFITLSFAHKINGIKYGPGRTEAPIACLAQLSKADYDRTAHELNLNNSNKRLFQLLENGQKIELPAQ